MAGDHPHLIEALVHRGDAAAAAAGTRAVYLRIVEADAASARAAAIRCGELLRDPVARRHASPRSAPRHR